MASSRNVGPGPCASSPRNALLRAPAVTWKVNWKVWRSGSQTEQGAYDLDGLLSHQGMLSYRGWWSSGGRAARGSWGGQGCVLTLTCHTHPPTSQQQFAKPTGEDWPKTQWELIRMQAGIIPVLEELRSWLGKQHINISKNWKNLHGRMEYT